MLEQHKQVASSNNSNSKYSYKRLYSTGTLRLLVLLYAKRLSLVCSALLLFCFGMAWHLKAKSILVKESHASSSVRIPLKK